MHSRSPASRDDLGRRVQHGELPRRLRGGGTRYREAGAALGFGRLGTFFNVTLPIGGRISLPASINTYISVVKNTSLMYVIGYPELTTTALNINANTPYTLETFATLAIAYLTVVWTLSALIRVLERRLALPKEGASCRAAGMGRARRALHARPRADGHDQDRGRPRDRQRGDRDSARDAPDDRFPAAASADPVLRRVLARPPDPRHRLHHLLRAAGDRAGPQVRPFTSATIGLILWGSAQVAEATRGAVGSIPREQHEAAPRSASAGSAATGT